MLALHRKVSGPEHPNTFSAVKDLAASYLDAGRQAEAIALGAEVSNLSPRYTHMALFIGAIQVWFTKEGEHTATVRRMLAWAANAGNADDAERVAKLTFLRPVADPSMVEAALALARKARKGMPKSPWGLMVLGIG